MKQQQPVYASFFPWYSEEEDIVKLYVACKIKSNFYASGSAYVVIFKDGLSEVVDSSLLVDVVSGDIDSIRTYDFGVIASEELLETR